MPGPVITTKYDQAIEEHGLRKQGLIGRGVGMGNALFSIDYDSLPNEARTTIKLIIDNGPFPYPGRDGSNFGNHFGDLPSGRYLEYTVQTPGCRGRGARRIVARKSTGQIFFTACHYERIGVRGGTKSEREQLQIQTTSEVYHDWRNGFYIITGMSLELRNSISQAIKGVS